MMGLLKMNRVKGRKVKKYMKVKKEMKVKKVNRGMDGMCRQELSSSSQREPFVRFRDAPRGPRPTIMTPCGGTRYDSDVTHTHVAPRTRACEGYGHDHDTRENVMGRT